MFKVRQKYLKMLIGGLWLLLIKTKNKYEILNKLIIQKV